jgi:hypothetical protein
VNVEMLALELIKLALAVAPAIVEAVTGQDSATLDERIRTARQSVRDPLDTSAADDARRAETRRIVGGEAPAESSEVADGE